ncbi:MAG: hypothetical protein RQ826_04810 [Xanthomonadales bacterium]|nr:hypothetical protein [Xanthomonadales bacterium]
MIPSNPTEQLVEDVAGVYFDAMDVAILRGVELDDAGKRGCSVAAEFWQKGFYVCGQARNWALLTIVDTSDTVN